MSWLFGKKKKEKKPQTPTIEQNSENLAKTLEDLRKKSEYDEKKSEEEKRKAIMYKKQNNIAKAKECLKRKKIIDTNRAKIDQMVLNLEAQQMQIQNAEITSKVFTAYVQNNEVMKNQFKGYDIDKIQDTLDDIQDAQESYNEITDAMAGANFGPQVDEDELDAEFDDLDVDEEAAPAGSIAAPSAPMANIAASNQNDDEEIGGLMAGFS